ncbi:MAG: 50S ribosomal protein L24 [Gammaproteobacteria bacterium]|nr:50S ribosomal protein L24 [Gammaproteobacteria bacterium]
MRKIRKGDDVIVIAGKDKGKRGSVMRVTSDNRVFVGGVNLVKRHTKANPNMGIAGGIIEKEASVAASNVMLFNPKTSKGERVGFKMLDDGRKVRIFKSSGDIVDV